MYVLNFTLLGVYINLFIFMLITPLMVMAGFAVAIAGYLFGAGLAWLFRLNRAQIIAVAIETSFQVGKYILCLDLLLGRRAVPATLN